MWPRIIEICIALWLIASHQLLGYQGNTDFAAAALIALFAVLSFVKRLSKIHLLQILPIALLLYTGYTYPDYQLPFALQNFILTAFVLLFLFIIPTDASMPPEEWREFLKRSGSKEE